MRNTLADSIPLLLTAPGNYSPQEDILSLPLKNVTNESIYLIHEQTVHL